MIVARGSRPALIELCEQFSWLGAALRSSSESSGLCFATPSVRAFRNSQLVDSIPSFRIDIGFNVRAGLSRSFSAAAESTCWHLMFRNPIVVQGFPILARYGTEKGLEIPLGIMSLLAEAHFATKYCETFILKGLCTMLVPTHQSKQSITWHFLFNKDGERLPYHAFRDRCRGWIAMDTVDDLFKEAEEARHFVGWASDITRHIGMIGFNCRPCAR